jgi:HSP20 family protein
MGQLLDGVRGLAAGGPVLDAPHADLSETDQTYVAETELPGVARDDISVELAGQELAVSGVFSDPVLRFRRPARPDRRA